MNHWMRSTAVVAAGWAACTAFGQMKAVVHATGFSLPVAMTQDPTLPNVQYVVQQRGRVRVIQSGVVLGTDFLDLTGIASTSGSERGLLGLAFHPQYATNGLFVVYYTDLTGRSQVVRYTRSAGNPVQANAGSAYPILSLAQPFTNHNGGTVRFGPDGNLYIGFGDGGSANDPGNRAQQITNQWLGKMLRVDINSDDFPKDATRNYHVPATNPFVGPTLGDDEIWSLGLRNPWKYSFDDPTKLGTGAMVIADVGQNAWEEIDYEPALARGRNYGWRVREGFVATGLSGGGNSVPFTDPIYAYPRTIGQSITGGYVYRGTRLGEMFGRYFYADYITGRVFSMKLTIHPATGEATASDVVEHTAALSAGFNVSSIDVDTDGELYLVDYSGGRVLKVVPQSAAWITGIGLELVGPLNGTVRHLLATDGKRVYLAQQEEQDTLEENSASMRVEFLTDLPTLATLDFEIEMQMLHLGTGFLKVAFYNWSTSRWVDVNTFVLQGTMQTYTMNNVPAGNYRRSDGAVYMNLRPYKFSPLNADPLGHLIEKVKVTVR